MQRLRTPVPGHLSSHCALSSYGLLAPLTLWRLSTTSGSGPGELPGFWDSMVVMLLSLGRGRVATTTHPRKIETTVRESGIREFGNHCCEIGSESVQNLFRGEMFYPDRRLKKCD